MEGVSGVAARRRLSGAIVRHAPFVAVVSIGVALRAITWRAVWPALLYADSREYLLIAARPSPAGHRPVGYSLFLGVLSLTAHVAVVTLVQHVLAVLIAVLLYALLLRTGVRPWLAALGCAPLLLDGFQIITEQYILSETLAEAFLAAAVAVLLWPVRPGWAAGLTAGALLAATALTRSAMLPLVVPAALFVLLRVASRRDVVAAGCLAIAFLAPVAAYATWNHEVTGRYAVSDYTGYFLYGRVAGFADCARLRLTAEERVLCPTGRTRGQEAGWYVWAPTSPITVSMTGVPILRRDAIALGFSTAVIEQQPVDYVRAVAADTLRSFATLRPSDANWPWLSWGGPPADMLATVGFEGRGSGPAETVQPHVSTRLVAFLDRYQRFAYLPGPLLAALLAAGVAGGAGLVRRSAGNRRLHWLALLTTLMAITLLVTPTMTAQFDLRYLQPTFLLLPLAAAATVELALRAIGSRPQPAPSAEAPA